MTNDTTLWATLRKHVPRRKWVSLQEIYQIVQRNVALDAEDLGCRSTHPASPRWKRNVRRLLHAKRHDGTLKSRVSQ